MTGNNRTAQRRLGARLCSGDDLHTSYLKDSSVEKVAASRVSHDDVIKWKHFPRYWPFERGNRRSLVNSPHKGQWRGALMFSLIWVWINGWVNNGEAGDLRRHGAHYDVNVMQNQFRYWFLKDWQYYHWSPFFVMLERPSFYYKGISILKIQQSWDYLIIIKLNPYTE